MLEAIIDMQCDCPDPDCSVREVSPYIVTFMATSERDIALLREFVRICDGQISRPPLRHLASTEQLVEAKMALESAFAQNDMFKILSRFGGPPPPSTGEAPEENPFKDLTEIDSEPLPSNDD